MKQTTFNSWMFASLAFLIMVILRFISPDVFWDIIDAFVKVGSIIGGWIT